MSRGKKLNILFVHSVCPGQFSELCEYLNVNGIANAYYMATSGNVEKNKNKYQNLVSFEPDGNVMVSNAYHYSGKVERASRISLGVYRSLIHFLKKVRVDLIVAHASLGSPHLLYDDFDIPIISYIEFPSYRDHGWSEEYPPHVSQKLSDKNFQMLSYYQVLKSYLTLVPSEYAKKMFPVELHHKIAVQFEGFCDRKIALSESCGIDVPLDKKIIGFSARDLSSAKGFDFFLEVSKKIITKCSDVHFVILGDETSTSYSYEDLYLETLYGKDKKKTFKQYLIKKLDLNLEFYTFSGKLPYAQYSDLISKVDLFLYPLRHGSGNWGVVELLMRSKPILASNACFLDEVFCCDDSLVDSMNVNDWAERAIDLVFDEVKLAAIVEAEKTAAGKYKLSVVAHEYMKHFDSVVSGFLSESS